MDKQEFKDLFERFEEQWGFKKEAFDNRLSIWQGFADEIISENGLPFDRWLKENEGEEYLTGFIDGLHMCGRSRVGDFEQVMIYKNSGNRSGQYYDRYIDPSVKINKKDGKYKDTLYTTDRQPVLEHYNEHIVPLLKKIVGATTLEELYECEQDEEYKNFSAKQVLRRITQLISFSEGEQEYKNGIMWIFRDKSVDDLVDIFFDDNNLEGRPADGSTFFQRSIAVYKRAKEWAKDGGDWSFEEEDKLNTLLWKMVSSGPEFKELTNFNNPNIIFHGAPGTGKTYSVLSVVKLITENDRKKYAYVQFHPSFSYQDFIEGIKPFGIKDGALNLKVVNGVFKQFCIDVKKQNEDFYRSNEQLGKKTANKNERKLKDLQKWPHYYFIIDEINRGNLSSILGETLSIIEKDYRDYDFSGVYDDNNADNLIETPLSNVISSLDPADKSALIYKEINGKARFAIPFNIHFIGSMNDVDKSIDSFDLALRRRFKWIYKECDYEAIEDVLSDLSFNQDAIGPYIDDCKRLNYFICNSDIDCLGLGPDYQIGQSTFMKIRKGRSGTISNTAKKELFADFIEPILKEYIREVSEESEIVVNIQKAKQAFGLLNE